MIMRYTGCSAISVQETILLYLVKSALPFCLARSSAFSKGAMILSTVRKAARLAVYDEMMMRVKNHQMPPTIRVEAALGFNPDPCRRNVPVMNQKEFDTENCRDDESRIHFKTASILGVLGANHSI